VCIFVVFVYILGFGSILDAVHGVASLICTVVVAHTEAGAPSSTSAWAFCMTRKSVTTSKFPSALGAFMWPFASM
jgi:hypothetical protein